MAKRLRTPKETRRAADTLRKIAELTTALPEDSPADARLRDRLELAADVLDALSDEENGVRDQRS